MAPALLPARAIRRAVVRNVPWLILAILFALPLSLASVVTAQQEPRPHPGALVEADWLLARPVVNENSREIGKVDSMSVDPKDGSITEIVIPVGGVLGIGDQHKKVAWRDARMEWQTRGRSCDCPMRSWAPPSVPRRPR
jgi:sporulation protein YlmC with PRC-barrel domain